MKKAIMLSLILCSPIFGINAIYRIFGRGPIMQVSYQDGTKKLYRTYPNPNGYYTKEDVQLIKILENGIRYELCTNKQYLTAKEFEAEYDTIHEQIYGVEAYKKIKVERTQAKKAREFYEWPVQPKHSE